MYMYKKVQLQKLYPERRYRIGAYHEQAISSSNPKSEASSIESGSFYCYHWRLLSLTTTSRQSFGQAKIYVHCYLEIGIAR
jgi:hypothetical protein